MLDKTYTVHVAREGGHEQETMTRQGIIDMVSTNDNTWVFVDSQMVSVEELETIELNNSTEIRINPGMVGGSETFKVFIANQTGDQEVMMSKQEIAGELSQNQGNWLFVDGQMVDASTLENTSITQDNVLRMVPSIVGGSDEATFTVQITDSTGHSVAQMSQTELACETESGKFIISSRWRHAINNNLSTRCSSRNYKAPRTHAKRINPSIIYLMNKAICSSW